MLFFYCLVKWTPFIKLLFLWNIFLQDKKHESNLPPSESHSHQRKTRFSSSAALYKEALNEKWIKGRSMISGHHPTKSNPKKVEVHTHLHLKYPSPHLFNNHELEVRTHFTYRFNFMHTKDPLAFDLYVCHICITIKLLSLKLWI